MITMGRIGVAALACAVALAGCQLGPRPLREAHALPEGEWAVTAIRWGAANVRDPNDVIQRYGQVIRYEPRRVVSGSESCTDPAYLASAILADHYLYGEFGVRAADLGLYRWQDVRVTEVFCNGHKWRALGGDAFWVDDDRGFAVRDDVLYELRRRKPAT
jgi:hypothetical protein